ncbi:MAG: 30S ribosomal protein S6 [Parcubacteria group bacterium GW2011_GWD2_38_12]|uniref:Small ribosomal subunit protein bS6 n=1 Tax=Candidatus Azambacteria bacterium RIFCSPLOWO2_01_FULL_37_9 TaxID=1797297 RepID=A0A1F5C894_9BACT|nr:MAG: 30S ribosomal protein S6 [Parcubacteria group bacterium GW2011_GWC2_36_17]KKQ42752.1 MAG: 30S ribosomal protein S6 [Parcubacteria group bacterium GW2011_GWE2_37_8]KKQ52932.1 MAG: 30S ribosomal protein S6 [Parcubacteria group bacterium GW2011_GWD2_38_12]KKQ59137.1 MAG: 30S ribosomal protein S6 [Parcubacteria group bacterium GW2011_GWC1_38_17]KKQ59750.1 MAG: 30S ribosomal protein S6 [Parcubacteria group bacterium GW2011_GWD1_38_16]OGD39085.1 MAG: 30S ribosomal protein S6 [Candidatus Azam
MTQYEIAYFLNPDIKEEEVQNVYLQKIKDSIAEFSGEIIKEQTVQKKKLTYPIKKAKQGYFGYMLFNLNPRDLKSLDKKLRLEDYILRYLVITVDNNYLSFMKRQEEEIKEKFQRITQPSESQSRKSVKSEDKLKLEAEIEKKLEEILEKTS